MAIKFNEERYREVFQSPAGTVGRFLNRRAFQLETAGKLIATQEGLVRSGRYRASITGRLVTEARGLVIKFGSAVPYAHILEHGSPPHVIAARRRVVSVLGNITRPGQEGGLWWTHGAERGWFVPDHPLQSVHHPGTRAYSVLLGAVAQVFRR